MDQVLSGGKLLQMRKPHQRHRANLPSLDETGRSGKQRSSCQLSIICPVFRTDVAGREQVSRYMVLRKVTSEDEDVGRESGLMETKEKPQHANIRVKTYTRSLRTATAWLSTWHPVTRDAVLFAGPARTHSMRYIQVLLHELHRYYFSPL
jgi:hypothetical protein